MNLYRNHFRNEYGKGSGGSNMFQSIAVKLPDDLHRRHIAGLSRAKHLFASYVPLDKAIVVAELQVAKNYGNKMWNDRWVETLRFLLYLKDNYYDPYVLVENNANKVSYASTEKQIARTNIKYIVRENRKLNFIKKWNAMKWEI